MSAPIIKFEPPGEIIFTCKFLDPFISYMNMAALWIFELKTTSAPHVLRFWNFVLYHVFEKYTDFIDVTAFSVYKNMTSEWTKYFSLISWCK